MYCARLHVVAKEPAVALLLVKRGLVGLCQCPRVRTDSMVLHHMVHHMVQPATCTGFRDAEFVVHVCVGTGYLHPEMDLVYCAYLLWVWFTKKPHSGGATCTVCQIQALPSKVMPTLPACGAAFHSVYSGIAVSHCVIDKHTVSASTL